MGKLQVLDQGGQWIAHDYGNAFFQQPLSSGQRLVIGPSQRPLELAMALSETWRSNRYFCLYVLLISHQDKEGRYQSPLLETFEDLQLFLYTHQTFLESDGRHHIWIASAAQEGMIIYDHHDVLFAYGDLERYGQILNERGFVHRDFWFPVPHQHSFPPANMHQEEELLQHFPWQQSPLLPGDDWS